MATKQCPYCGETIQATAKKCRYCGEWLENTDQPTILQHTQPTAQVQVSELHIADHKQVPKLKQLSYLLWILGGITALSALLYDMLYFDYHHYNLTDFPNMDSTAGFMYLLKMFEPLALFTAVLGIYKFNKSLFHTDQITNTKGWLISTTAWAILTFVLEITQCFESDTTNTIVGICGLVISIAYYVFSILCAKQMKQKWHWQVPQNNIIKPKIPFIDYFGMIILILTICNIAFGLLSLSGSQAIIFFSRHYRTHTCAITFYHL